MAEAPLPPPGDLPVITPPAPGHDDGGGPAGGGSGASVRLDRSPPPDPGGPPGRRSVAPVVLALGMVVALAAVTLGVARASIPGGTTPRSTPVPERVRSVDVYGGLGTWVDVFDFAPSYQPPGGEPPVRPDDVAILADYGVTTLYLQVARNDLPPESPIVDPGVVGAFLRSAHEVGVNVVGWYSVGLSDPEADLTRIRAMLDLDQEGHRLDGVALDIEEVRPVPDAGARSAILRELLAAVDEAAGDDPVGAIVLPPVLLEDVNPDLWPAFPWDALAEHTDAVAPMAYWTFRSQSSPWRDAYRYTAENIRLVRLRVGPDTPVHVIGGVAADATPGDYADFVRAVADLAPAGASMFDARTTSTDGWLTLRRTLDAFGPVGPLTNP